MKMNKNIVNKNKYFKNTAQFKPMTTNQVFLIKLAIIQ